MASSMNKKTQLEEAKKKVERMERELEEAKVQVAKAEKEWEEEEAAKKREGTKTAEKKRDPQDIKLVTPFPVKIEDGKMGVVFEGIKGNLKWPAMLRADGWNCCGRRKDTIAKCRVPSSRLAEHHNEAELKQMLYLHAECCVGVGSGPRPEFPIWRNHRTGKK